MVQSLTRSVPALGLLAMLGFCSTGCERKEKVVDIQTPAGDVEVTRDIDDGDVDVDVSDNP